MLRFDNQHYGQKDLSLVSELVLWVISSFSKDVHVPLLDLISTHLVNDCIFCVKRYLSCDVISNNVVLWQV